MDLIKEIKRLHESIEKSLKESHFDQTIHDLDRLEKLAKTEKYYVGYSSVMFYLNEFDKVEKYINEGLMQFSYSFSLHFNAVILSYMHGQLEKCFEHIGKCIKYTDTEDQNEAINKKLNEIYYELHKQNYSDSYLKSLLSLAENIRLESDDRSYPLDRLDKSLIRKVQNSGTDFENMTNLYKNMLFNDIDGHSRYYSKVESFIGHKDTYYSFHFDVKSALPISFIEKGTVMNITLNGESYNFEDSLIKYNQFNYLSFDPGNIEIKADKPIFIGEPIALIDKTLKKYKLIMHVFIDGLSAKFLENEEEDLIPSIKTTFQKKYENNNCYASADWTFPSNAGLFTGMDTIANGQYHPYFPHNFSEKQKSLVEIIRKNGYYTTSFNSCWRSTPRQGYAGSFNRMVFKNSLGGFGVAEKVDEVIDHLDALKHKNNYIWFGVPDLHDVADEFFRSINTQINICALDRIKSEKGETSVLSKFDEVKVNRYREEIKRVDLHLSRLFTYIKNEYSEDDVLIIIHSDHGQGYLKKDPDQFLHEERIKVPFMLLGGVESKTSNEVMSNLDIYPTVLDIIGVNYDKDHLHGKSLMDFNGPGRTEVLTETYHPDQTYKAMIKTDSIQIYFETDDNVDKFGGIDLENYKVSYHKLSEELSDEEAEQLRRYYVDWILQKRALLQR